MILGYEYLLVANMKKARIVEIFNSIQGEGLYAGEEQTFVRFYGCNMNCKFCDESAKKNFIEYTPDEAIQRIMDGAKNTISMTGGEPLLHTDFLKEMLPFLKNKGFNIYLETNGILKDRLLEVLDFIDIISMDFKLPSSTGGPMYWTEHVDFLKAALRKEVFVKSVVTRETAIKDIETASTLISQINKDVVFIIQPASVGSKTEHAELLDAFFETANSRLNNVKVMQQLHKILGVR